ncbi:MAG: hypothetical protein JST26_19090 [Bacteroidetes bacterium]|nr:hypothetical protein [Bacteroidota bacterium]
MRNCLQILVCGLVFMISSCNKEKLKAPEASYLRIDTADVLITQPNSQGTASSKITDIWVYVDSKFKGAFPVGNLIPIASSGSTDIQIYGGIKNNGISATRMPYYFLQGLDVNLELKPSQTVYMHPKFPYKTSTVFHQIENCEPGGSSFENAPDTDIPFTIITASTSAASNIFEGQGSLSMSMTDALPVCKVRSANTYTLPIAGSTVYMELNYKTNQQIEVGINNDGGDRPALTINPSDGEWKKIYVRLTDVVSEQPTYTYSRIYIKATKQVSSPEIYIDNVKLISE